MFIAFGDSNKYISLFQFGQINHNIKKFVGDGSGGFNVLKNEPEPQRLEMEAHTDSVNAVVFTRLNKYYLVSGSSDKCIIVWRINQDDMAFKNVKLIRTNSDVTEIVLLPNDEMMFVGCVDNNIYLYRSNFQNKTFECFNHINIHQTYVTSICLDPFLEKYIKNNNGSSLNTLLKFVSYVYRCLIYRLMMGG
jgi:WD40 repeat protein